MSHGKRYVIFVVESTRNECDRASRHDLADEDHSSTNLAPFVAPHIEPQIHFREVRVKGNLDAEDFRVYESKSDQTDEGF